MKNLTILTTPVWKLEQAIRVIDKEIAELQARRGRIAQRLSDIRAYNAAVATPKKDPAT